MEIQGYSNYLIYPDGRVFSKKSNRFLKPYLTGNKKKCQYYVVKLFDEKNKLQYKVHRLVACHYIPNPDNLPTVDHIDRNPHNNHYTNLRWADHKMQRSNQKEYPLINKSNTSGFRYITHDSSVNIWRFNDAKRRVWKQSKNKIDMICYKYIHNLRIKAGHFT